jgi:hypothetical protein
MLLLAATALATQPIPTEIRPARQARALVTIIKSEQLRFAEIEKTQPQRLRLSTIRASDGLRQSAKLVEFE